MSAHEKIEEFHLDAIGEILNIGVGAAASSLSEMVDYPVSLNVPVVKFVTRMEAIKLLEKQSNVDVSGIIQRYGGGFTGSGLLLFPGVHGLELIRAVLKQDVTLQDLSEMEEEAMAEIGNVILNACICSIADLFHRSVEGSIPVFIKGSVEEVFSADHANENLFNALVLFLNMSFSVDNKDIKGFITFLMDSKSVDLLIQNIREYMGSV